MSGWRSGRDTGWSPIRFARRSTLGHRRGQTLALVAVSALITACTAFAPVYDRAMQQALVDTLLTHASTAQKTVTVQSDDVHWTTPYPFWKLVSWPAFGTVENRPHVGSDDAMRTSVTS